MITVPPSGNLLHLLYNFRLFLKDTIAALTVMKRKFRLLHNKIIGCLTSFSHRPSSRRLNALTRIAGVQLIAGRRTPPLFQIRPATGQIYPFSLFSTREQFKASVDEERERVRFVLPFISRRGEDLRVSGKTSPGTGFLKHQRFLSSFTRSVCANCTPKFP